jgi:hypothetical protein
MVDPIASSTVKSTTEFFKEATKQLQNANEQVSKFEQLRTQLENQHTNVSKTGAEKDNFQIQKPGETQQVNPSADAQKVGEIPKVKDMPGLEKMVNRLKAGQNRLQELMKDATSGRTFSPPELIALQAEVSTITTEIQFCSKIVEQGCSALKSSMQMQV